MEQGELLEEFQIIKSIKLTTGQIFNLKAIKPANRRKPWRTIDLPPSKVYAIISSQVGVFPQIDQEDPSRVFVHELVIKRQPDLGPIRDRFEANSCTWPR